MFLNCTNHPSCNWGEKQYSEASKYGEVVDFKFPDSDYGYSPECDENDVVKIALKVADDIEKLKPSCILLAGEWTLTYALVGELKSRGLKVVASCAHRDTKETKLEDGTLQKVSNFRFIRFREYTSVR
jgi:hypothetical protein